MPAHLVHLYFHWGLAKFHFSRRLRKTKAHKKATHPAPPLSALKKEVNTRRMDTHKMIWTQPGRTKTVMEMMLDPEFLVCFAKTSVPQNRWIKYPSNHTLNWRLSTAIQSVVFIFSSPLQERWEGKEHHQSPLTLSSKVWKVKKNTFKLFGLIHYFLCSFVSPKSLICHGYVFFSFKQSKLIHMILNAQNTAETLLLSVKCT